MKTKILFIVGVISMMIFAVFGDGIVTAPTYDPVVAYHAAGGNTGQSFTNTTFVGTTTIPTVTNGTFVGIIESAVTNSDLTASLPLWAGSDKTITNKTVAATKVALGIQAGLGVSTSDGTVTNTFSTAFSSAPIVVTTINAASGGTTNWIVSVTASNFIWKCGATGLTNYWIAVGAPVAP